MKPIEILAIGGLAFVAFAAMLSVAAMDTQPVHYYPITRAGQ